LVSDPKVITEVALGVAVGTTIFVQDELERHPVKPERLFKAVCRASHWDELNSKEDQFLALFGRYRSSK
jgi:hypothetical protein